MKIFREWIYQCWLDDARRKFKNLRGHIDQSQSILELGSGLGSLWHILDQEGYNVKGVDIKAKNVRDRYQPLIFDGETLPFSDQSFDIVLISTVLHHCSSPEAILKEAKRVGKRILIIEDLAYGRWHLPLLKLTDACVNWEFMGHPFNFRTHTQWAETFNNLGLKRLNFGIFSVAFFFKQVVYVLE